MAEDLEKEGLAEDTEAEVDESESEGSKVKSKDSKKSKKAKKAKSHKVRNYLKELKSELHKITWYPRKDTINATIWVCVALVILGAILGAVDYLLGQGVALLGSIVG